MEETFIGISIPLAIPIQTSSRVTLSVTEQMSI